MTDALNARFARPEAAGLRLKRLRCSGDHSAPDNSRRRLLIWTYANVLIVQQSPLNYPLVRFWAYYCANAVTPRHEQFVAILRTLRPFEQLLSIE